MWLSVPALVLFRSSWITGLLGNWFGRVIIFFILILEGRTLEVKVQVFTASYFWCCQNFQSFQNLSLKFGRVNFEFSVN